MFAPVITFSCSVHAAADDDVDVQTTSDQTAAASLA